MFTQVLLVLFILVIVKGNVYLYNTEDSSSLEFYDCVHHNNLLYCRRPFGPITLQRENETWECYNNGTVHLFSSLLKKNINVSFVLHNLRSTIEKAEEYARYIRQSINGSDNSLCECNDLQSFGKYCEYLLPFGTIFEETLNWEIEMHKNDEDGMQIYGDILCYRTLSCNSGLLCLDWRDMCDGVQQCMFGSDEENCDLMEFNECENNEYRCMNGMCIPDEYYLDGEYDCMDMTDEMGYYNDAQCTFEQVSLECDDRMCLRNKYSCGDGQCIVDRLAFQKKIPWYSECKSLRDQYYICETHESTKSWTLPNGRCFLKGDYDEIDVLNRSSTEERIYFLKCALSQGAIKNCPPAKDRFGIKQIESHSLSSSIQYPIGAIIAPYTIHFYNIRRRWSRYFPDFIEINASIKCRGHIINRQMILPYFTGMNLRNLEELLCVSSSNISAATNGGYDQFCYNASKTFNNYPYNFIDVCNRSKECISAYRIADGLQDCEDNMDEEKKELVSSSCSKIQRHRFRCSAKQPTCLSINVLGDQLGHCINKYDEIWIEKDFLLSKLKCNRRSKEDCGMIRQYVEDSWNNEVTASVQSTKKIPFRGYCDTFWDLASKGDEESIICQKWWICLGEQWQCRTGQCINADWVLDGEWDCSDASDEDGIFISNHTLLPHNLRVVERSELEDKFAKLYSGQPFWNICNFTVEFPCFPINSSYSLAHNIRGRPCISLEKVGDGHVDCLGGLDERNTLEHCNDSNTLGYDFKCLSSKTCMPFSDICVNRCPDSIDDKLVCTGVRDTENCKNHADFTCYNGTCATASWCNGKHDCFYGEDEYLCNIPGPTRDLRNGLYRRQKESIVRNMQQNLNLPVFPVNIKRTTISRVINPTMQRTLIETNSSNLTSTLAAYVCNRGVGIYMHNGSIACFCPQQYYGDKCQFHSDRVTLLLHLNISQSNYNESTNPAIVLKMLALFLFKDEILDTNEFHVRPAVELNIPKKEIIRFLYSRSNDSLEKKRERYFNRSNIIHEHPYSVRIEAYELNLNKTPRLVAVWQYPIYFDYLPSFRLVKILRLKKIENIRNPCSNNSCGRHHECHQLLNRQLEYICLCASNCKGNDSSIYDQSCSTEFCSSDALCKPNYRGSRSGNESPYCICPLGRYGDRCELIHDVCNSNPCQNEGICLPSGKSSQYYCQCPHSYYGKQCELLIQSTTLYINESVKHRAIVVQYFQIDFSSLNLILVHQNVFARFPDILHYFHDPTRFPEMIVAKQYSDLQSNLYIISLQMNTTSVNGTTQMSEINRCINVRMLIPTNEEMFPFQYHHLCIKNVSLFCFFDDIYLCICDKNHSRVECFGYDHNLDRCSSCFANGRCLKGDRSRINDFLCLCPRCFYGSLCQFSNEGLSFTLDSLIIQVNRDIQIIYLIFSFLIFLVGGLTNYASIVTFKRANLLHSSVGIYLLYLSVNSQYSLFLLLMKIVPILFHSLMNDISCKIISYMLFVSIRYSLWLTSWIAIERVCYLLFPFVTLLKKPRVAKIISFVTLLIVGIMDVHELIFYMKDPSGQTACVVNFPMKIKTYDRITVIIHYIIPFCIQILSITVLIILAARSRSRTTNNLDSFVQYLKRQFKNQKELYITPIVIVLSGLPQSILSFSFACIELDTWQKHALLIAYFLSYVPQLLGFVLFVLPSTSYMKQFRASKLSKTFIFRWILSNKKGLATIQYHLKRDRNDAL